MSERPETAVARLLTETLAAHSLHETDELSGVYDEDWAAWYAAYLLAHGLADVLPGAAGVDAAELATVLGQLHAEHGREAPREAWPVFYAARLGARIERLRGDRETD